MRSAVWLSMTLALAAGACGVERREANEAGASVETPLEGPASAVARQDDGLTPQARSTFERLQTEGESGTYRSLARLAAETPNFISNYGGVNHLDFWYLKYRTGDWPTRQLQAVLAYPPAVEETPQGRVFVWPYMAEAGPMDVTPDVERDMAALVGDWQADAVRAGQPYQGYRVGVREDGVWLYFVAGEGIDP